MKKGVLLSAFMTAHSLISGVSASADSGQELMQTQIIETKNDLNLSHLCDRQFILIGDTNHDDPAVQRGIYSPELLVELNKCGIKKIFMEIDASGQIFIDALKAGVFTPEDLARQAYGVDNDPTKYSDIDVLRDISLAQDRFILEASKLDIQILAIDDQKEALRLKHESNNARSEAIKAWTKDMSEEMTQAYRHVFLTSSASQDTKDTVIQALYDLEDSDPETYAAGAELYEKYINKQNEVISLRNNDENLHRAIMGQIEPNEQVAIIFGNAHFEGDNSLKVLLGSDSTRHIVVGDVSYGTNADMVIDKQIFASTAQRPNFNPSPIRIP